MGARVERRKLKVYCVHTVEVSSTVYEQDCKRQHMITMIKMIAITMTEI